MKEKLVELGYCNKPHGIKGAFSFFLINGKDSVLKKGMLVSLHPANERSSLDERGEPFKIAKIQHGNKVIVELEGVFDRNQVESMVPFSIWLTREQFPKLVEGEIYLSDLIGYKVLDESMADYGKVVEIGTNGVQDILCVEDLNGEIVEILLIDQFVTEINSEKKTVHINVPELI